MRTRQERERLRQQAIILRRQGKSRRQIKEILGPMSNATLNDALKDEPPPEWARRPNAKDDLRAKARQLRALGQDYEEIATALGVAKSSVSLWVRDLPRVTRFSTDEGKKRSAEGARRYGAAKRQATEANRSAVRAAAAKEIGDLTNRELVIAGAIAYWCEGSKNKPGPWNDHVAFTNSDPTLIRFFLRFLEVTGTPPEAITFRIYIHESADLESAQRFWLEATNASPDQFRAPTLKRHNPKTVRRNVGEGYYGCLRVDVRRSTALYHKIEGWAAASMAQRRSVSRVPTDKKSAPSEPADTATTARPVS